MDDTRYAEMRGAIIAANRDSESPLPVCKTCHWPVQKGDMDWLFRGRCATCGVRRLERMISKIVKRHGRRRALKALRWLAH